VFICFTRPEQAEELSVTKREEYNGVFLFLKCATAIDFHIEGTAQT